jgi:hypothetical protein
MTGITGEAEKLQRTLQAKNCLYKLIRRLPRCVQKALHNTCQRSIEYIKFPNIHH